jgi:hypothetical protein
MIPDNISDNQAALDQHVLQIIARIPTIDWDMLVVGAGRSYNSPPTIYFNTRTGQVYFANDSGDLPADISEDELYDSIAVPAMSSDAFEDMVDFIITVNEEAVRDELRQALDSRHPFGVFKGVLLAYPSERKRWFHFYHTQCYDRIHSWVEEQLRRQLEIDLRFSDAQPNA